MTLAQSILGLQQQIARLATNPFFEALDQGFLDALEKHAKADKGANYFVRELSAIIQQITTVDDIPRQRELLTKYGEARVYAQLRSILPTTIIPEGATPSPDLNFDSTDYFAETKCLQMAGGDLKYRNTLEGSLDANIEVEKRLEDGQTVAFGEHAIRPHLRHGKESTYDPGSVQLVTQNLIEKFELNYKSGQFSRGPTLACIYLNAYHFPLYGLGNLKEKCCPVFFDHQMNVPITGELWCAAFGRRGDNIFRPPEFEGLANIEGVLSKSGILEEHSDIEAVVFFVDSISHALERAALIRSSASEESKKLIDRIAPIWNDEQSRHTWELLAR